MSMHTRVYIDRTKNQRENVIFTVLILGITSNKFIYITTSHMKATHFIIIFQFLLK